MAVLPAISATTRREISPPASAEDSNESVSCDGAQADSVSLLAPSGISEQKRFLSKSDAASRSLRLRSKVSAVHRSGLGKRERELASFAESSSHVWLERLVNIGNDVNAELSRR